jgi:hypothetical protein
MTVLEQARNIRKAMDSASLVLTDEQALESIGIYPRWEELVEKSETVEMGFRFRYGEKLYKVLQPQYTFTDVYVPGAGTESLFARIDETHAGTAEDPIPYEGNMALEEGKHYSQGGRAYLCTRSTGAAVFAHLAELVGLYVVAL